MYAERVLSGMRPTVSLHLVHYHGVLTHWVKLQHEYPCLFFVADWHALTTHYDNPQGIEKASMDMVVDWLAAGVDPNQATLFIQSKVPEHAELPLLMSMMSADILIYRADKVPVGEDQIPHVEFTRELARRFNHMYGREPGFEEKAREAVKKLGSKKARLYEELRTGFVQNGDKEALEQGKALLNEIQHLTALDRERLFGYIEGSGKMVRRCPSRTTTPSPCANRKNRWPRRSRACRPIPIACAVPSRAIRHVVRCGNYTRCIPTTAPRNGCSRVARQLAS